jgi:hypothetical protein
LLKSTACWKAGVVDAVADRDGFTGAVAACRLAGGASIGG